MTSIFLIIMLVVLPGITHASEIIPPDMLLVQTIKDLKKSNPPVDHWAIDYAQVQRSNPKLDKTKIDQLLKSIDTEKLILAEHDHLSTSLEMEEPTHIIFQFEARKSHNTKGPPTYYVLIKIVINELPEK